MVRRQVRNSGHKKFIVYQATSRGTGRSAAWAFAQTFLPLPAGSVHRSAGTNNLPAELLFIIFWLAFLQQLDWRMTLPPYDFDALSPSLFPFALAAVCSLWRDVISLVPEYWMNVVVFVGSEVTCPEAITSQFSWSRGLLWCVDRGNDRHNTRRHCET